MEECKNCGAPLGRNKMYCSQKCRAEYIKNRRECVVCGKIFWASPSSDLKTCSRECQRINRAKQSTENNRIVCAMQKAREDACKSPNMAPVETNVNAKSWVIKSPSGDVYQICNLELWARVNEDILPSSAKLFADGIRGIKASYKGKRKNPYYHYKGWSLTYFCEENLARENIAKKSKRKRVKMSEEERLEKKRLREKERYKRKKEEAEGRVHL